MYVYHYLYVSLNSLISKAIFKKREFEDMTKIYTAYSTDAVYICGPNWGGLTYDTYSWTIQ